MGRSSWTMCITINLIGDMNDCICELAARDIRVRASGTFTSFSSVITVTSCESCGIRNQEQLTCLFTSLFKLTNQTLNNNWPFHLWQVDSPYKGPYFHKSFPCYDVVLFRAVEMMTSISGVLVTSYDIIDLGHCRYRTRKGLGST